MTTNSREPSLTLDLLPKFYSATADIGYRYLMDFVRHNFLLKKQNKTIKLPELLETNNNNEQTQGLKI